MADRKPLKVLPDGGGDSTGLGEFVAADTVGIVDGGTGLATVGSNQLLTGNGTSALTSESNLTFDGSTLTVAGDQVITDGNGLISGHTARVQVGWATGENQILGTADADANLSITRYSADNGPPNLFFGKSRGSLGANTIVADGDPLGRITFCGSDGVDMRSAAAWIEAECDGEFEADNVSGRIIFATTPDNAGSQDPTERMRIDSSGNVMMDASGTFAASGFLNVENTANAQTLYVGARNTGFTQHVIRAFCYRTANSAYNFLDCQSDMAGSNDTEFKLRGDGEAYADGSWNNSGADYQEFFESSDGSALEVGKSVVMDGDKVRVYNASSDSADNIIGVVRPKADNKNSAVIGNTAWNHWTDKYLTDDWGVYLREDVTVWEWDEVRYADGDDIPEDKQIGDVKIVEGSGYERVELAKDAEWTPPSHAKSSIQSVRKLNPDYDESQDDDYKAREDRDEWNLIGLLGQVQIKANEPTRPTWIKMKNISDAVELWLVR